MGKTCFKMNLSSKIGITVLTTELTSIVAFSRYQVPTDTSSIFIYVKLTQPTIFLDSLIRMANDRNTSLETLYDGQFTLTTQLIEPRYIAKE